MMNIVTIDVPTYERNSNPSASSPDTRCSRRTVLASAAVVALLVGAALAVAFAYPASSATESSSSNGASITSALGDATTGSEKLPYYTSKGETEKELYTEFYAADEKGRPVLPEEVEPAERKESFDANSDSSSVDNPYHVNEGETEKELYTAYHGENGENEPQIIDEAPTDGVDDRSSPSATEEEAATNKGLSGSGEEDVDIAIPHQTADSSTGCQPSTNGIGPSLNDAHWTVLRANDEDSDGSDFFGNSVALSHDTLVAGAFRDEHHDGTTMGGTAFVFVKGDDGKFVQKQKLVPSDGSSADEFGISVAVDRTAGLLVVGATGDDDGNSDLPKSGSVYIYTLDEESKEWVEMAKIRPSTSSEYQHFGTSVAVRGNILVVGADGDLGEAGLESSGAVYVFERRHHASSEWIETAVISPPTDDADVEAYFGDAVAISGDTVVIGAHYDDNENGNEAGSAYVYSRIPNSGMYELQAKLMAHDGQPEDDFGVEVHISEDAKTIVVGASKDDHSEGYAHRDAGSAYVFTKDDKTAQWTEVAKLKPEGATTYKDYFGFSVQISKDTIVVGAMYDDDGSFNAGSLYVFKEVDNEWIQQHKLLPDEIGSGDTFGFSIAIDGSTVVVSAHGDDHNGSGSGAAYAIELEC